MTPKFVPRKIIAWIFSQNLFTKEYYFDLFFSFFLFSLVCSVIYILNDIKDIDIAKRLIDEAFEGGADAIKFQTYKADTIASKDSPASLFISVNSSAVGDLSSCPITANLRDACPI